MVVHHAIRLCICCIRSGSSRSSSAGQTEAAQRAALTAPPEIRNAEGSYVSRDKFFAQLCGQGVHRLLEVGGLREEGERDDLIRPLSHEGLEGMFSFQ